MQHFNNDDYIIFTFFILVHKMIEALILSILSAALNVCVIYAHKRSKKHLCVLTSELEIHKEELKM